MNDDPLYREIILEHFEDPQNYGIVKNPDFVLSGNNPTCGDKVKITGIIRNGIVTEIKFTSQGCAISKASASLLSQKVKGMTILEVKKITQNQALKVLPIAITPARFNCALLFYKTLTIKL